MNVKIFDYIRKRPENRALFKWLSTQKTALVEFGLLELDLSPYTALLKRQTSFPDFQLPPSKGEEIVFVDGSAFFQDSPGVTLSGSAVIKVDYLKRNFITIADMPVPECDHSSFRAEVFSIFLTLSCIYQPIIYSYCQTVVTHLQTLLECHQGYPPYSIGSLGYLGSNLEAHL